MKKLKFALLLLCFLVYTSSLAQDDLLSLLGEEEETTEYAKASFKTTRVINGHSLENVAGGVMDVKISHRFGMLNTGAYNLFGLDQASIRIGFDYGVNERLMVGLGRSSHNKVYDGFVKYKLLRQSSGKKNMPISLAVLSGAYLKTIEWQQPERENYFSSRLEYTHQLIVGRKFSESTTLQFMPTIVHRNLVAAKADAHDVILIGAAARQKLTKRVAINVEYYHALPDQLPADRKNSLAIGFDIETGGHVFQLHFTNSTSMIEPGFMTETIGDWGKGDVHFGFNVSRVFTIRKPKKLES